MGRWWPFGGRSRGQAVGRHDPRGADIRVGDLVEFVGTVADAEHCAARGLPLVRPAERFTVARVLYSLPVHGGGDTGVGLDLKEFGAVPGWAFPARLFRKVPPATRSKVIEAIIAEHTVKRQPEAA
jgi:hypothetical protein